MTRFCAEKWTVCRSPGNIVYRVYSTIQTTSLDFIWCMQLLSFVAGMWKNVRVGLRCELHPDRLLREEWTVCRSPGNIVYRVYLTIQTVFTDVISCMQSLSFLSGMWKNVRVGLRCSLHLMRSDRLLREKWTVCQSPGNIVY